MQQDLITEKYEYIFSYERFENELIESNAETRKASSNDTKH